jgi:hypothetical protein
VTPLPSEGDVTEQPRSKSIEYAMTSLPGLVGIFLGLVYAVGIIQIAGQADAAGLSTLNVAQLFSLDAILARGVAFGLPFAAMILLILIVAACAAPVLEWVETSEIGDALFGAVVRGTSARVLLIASVGAMLLIALFQTILALGFLLSIAVIALTYWRLGLAGWARSGAATLAAIFGLLTIVVLGSFYAARPYAPASLRLLDGQTVKGGLIRQTETMIYLDRTGRHEIAAIPVRSIRHLEIGDVPRRGPDSLVHLIFR